MVRVAACQFHPASNILARKEQVSGLLKKATGSHVDFVCLPEGVLTGYYEEEELARKSALEVGKSAFEEWIHVIKESAPHAAVIVGFNERDGDYLFDSAAIIEGGKLLGIQRKHYVYHPYFTAGSSYSSFQSKGITFGVMICLDATYFEPARLLALQGASIIFMPMCNRVSLDHPYAMRPPYYSNLVARSFENRSWIITADWVCPSDGVSVCPGNSVVYDPNGLEMARSLEGAEQVLLFDIPVDRCFREKGRRVLGSDVLVKELNRVKDTTCLA